MDFYIPGTCIKVCTCGGKCGCGGGGARGGSQGVGPPYGPSSPWPTGPGTPAPGDASPTTHAPGGPSTPAPGPLTPAPGGGGPTSPGAGTPATPTGAGWNFTSGGGWGGFPPGVMEPRPPSPGEPGYGPGGLPGQPGAPERRTLESCLTSCKTDNDCCDQSVTAKFTFQDGRGNTQIDLEKAVNVRGIREKPPKKLEAVGDQEICTFLIEDLKISPLVAKRLANELKKLKKYTKLASAPGAILSAGGLIGDAFYARAKGEIQKLSNMKHAGVDILICIPCCRRKPKNFWSRETTGSCDTQMYWLSLSWPMEGTTVEEARIFGWNRYADRDDRTKTWSLNPGEAEPRGNKPFRRVIDEQLELFNLLWKARCNEGELPGHCDDDCKSC